VELTSGSLVELTVEFEVADYPSSLYKQILECSSCLIMHSMSHVRCACIGLRHISKDAKQRTMSQEAQHFHVQQLPVHQALKCVCIDVMLI